MICNRKVKLSDIDRLVQMETQLYQYHAKSDDRFKKVESISKSAVEDEVSNLEYYFVISEEHYVFGFIKCLEKEVKENEIVKERKYMEILDLIIEEAYRNKGYGKNLIRYIEAIAKEKQFDCVEIPVYCFNEQANAFYEENGYRNYVVRKFKKIREEENREN
jgi:ribosomal protein S18 acetylase RimI-like enzyme